MLYRYPTNDPWEGIGVAVWGAKAFGKNGFLHSRFSFHKMRRAFKKRHFVVVAQIGGHSLVQGSLAVSQAGIQLWASQLWGEKSLPKKISASPSLERLDFQSKEECIPSLAVPRPETWKFPLLHFWRKDESGNWTKKWCSPLAASLSMLEDKDKHWEIGSETTIRGTAGL